MFNVGGGELLVIMLIALIVLGPQRLPDAAKQVGRVVGDLRRISSGFQQELKDALDTDDAPTPLRRKESAPLAATVADADRRPARVLGADAATGTTTGAVALGADDGNGDAAGLTSPGARDSRAGDRPATGRDTRDQTTVAPAVAAALDEVVAPVDASTDGSTTDGAPLAPPDGPTAEGGPTTPGRPTAAPPPTAGGRPSTGERPAPGDTTPAAEQSAGRGPAAIGDERAAS